MSQYRVMVGEDEVDTEFDTFVKALNYVKTMRHGHFQIINRDRCNGSFEGGRWVFDNGLTQEEREALLEAL